MLGKNSINVKTRRSHPENKNRFGGCHQTEFYAIIIQCQSRCRTETIPLVMIFSFETVP